MGPVLLGRALGRPAPGGLGELRGALGAANGAEAGDIVAVSRGYSEMLGVSEDWVDAFYFFPKQCVHTEAFLRWKGGCLIRVLTLVCGILPANFHIKWLL